MFKFSKYWQGKQLRTGVKPSPEPPMTLQSPKEQTEVALEGSQLGEQALKQSIERQQIGTVRPFEILQAMEIYIKSRLDHLKAVSTYNKALYKIFVAMGNDL